MVYQLLIALGTGILGALFGLLAGASGPVVLARRSNLEWLRGARAQVCDRFYALVVGAAENLQSGEQFDGMAASTSYRELSEAAAALDLYCSPRLSRAAQSVARTYRHCLTWDFSDDETFEFTLERLSRLNEEFLREVDQVKRLIQAELLRPVVQAADPIRA